MNSIRRPFAGCILAACLLPGGRAAGAQVPVAPKAPECYFVNDQASGQARSSCRFKESLSGTPTSVAGNRVILYRRSANGGRATSRRHTQDALERLAVRYGFTLTVSEDPAVFTAENLANTKVVIMSHGDGDVVPAGTYRTALQDFQMVNGWGVIWLNAACAFITSGWPFGQQSCVQQYFHHDLAGTKRRVFVDSGTSTNPHQGIRNPQTEFLLRSLPGWNADRTILASDEFYCFAAPARNTAGVNVLLGYDRSSGLPFDGNCFNRSDASEPASQDHNLAWTRFMGNGITIYNSLGYDSSAYTGNANAGDSLLWRFIRYAAKDWEAPPVAETLFGAGGRGMLDPSVSAGVLSMTFADAGRNAVTVSDVSGRKVFARTFEGVSRAEIPNLKRGIYVVKVVSGGRIESRKIRIF